MTLILAGMRHRQIYFVIDTVRRACLIGQGGNLCTQGQDFSSLSSFLNKTLYHSILLFYLCRKICN
jgi:hypothetical protein